MVLRNYYSRVDAARRSDRRLLLALLLFFSHLWLFGCVTPAPELQEEPPNQIAVVPAAPAVPTPTTVLKPLLWEIRSPGGAHVSYLFGTIHVGVPSQDLPGVVWEKFNKAGTLVVEVDPEALKKEPRDPKALMLEQGKSLRVMLGENDWNKLVELLGDAVTPEMLSHMKPHVAVSLVLIKLFPSSQGMDFVFSERAGDLKKITIGLETYSFQEDLLGRVLDMGVLRKVIENYSSLQAEADSLVKTYRSGDEKALSEFLVHTSLAGMPMDERSRQELIVRRNHSWIRQLRDLVGKQDIFIAVGAGHLPGSDGLIALLQKDGYILKRVVDDTATSAVHDKSKGL